MNTPTSDIHPSGNGHEHITSAATIRALDRLEIKVKLLHIQPQDIILLQFSSQPTVDEVLDLQHNIKHMMEHLKLDFPVFWMLIPPGLSMTQLDPIEMEKMGWKRIEEETP